MESLDSASTAVDVWRDTIQATWQDLKGEGRDPKHMFAAWADVKPSTAYAWKNGKCTPDLGTAYRLARNAAADGYTRLADLALDGSHRIAKMSGEVMIDGCVSDEARDITKILNDIYEADQNGDTEKLHALAEELHHEAEQLAAEADRQKAR
jgi:DNA-binding XRE family transcriptional regulator